MILIKKYHLIFAYGKDNFLDYQKNLIVAMAYGLWINDKTLAFMEKLNELFYYISMDINKAEGDDITMIGKIYYNKLAEIRNELEFNVRNDLLYLYDFSKFSKKGRRSKRSIRMIP